jgi:hypothetical protein
MGKITRSTHISHNPRYYNGRQKAANAGRQLSALNFQSKKNPVNRTGQEEDRFE